MPRPCWLGTGGGYPACPDSVRRFCPDGPQPHFLLPRHAVCGATRDGPAAVAGDFNFDLDHPLRAAPSLLASLPIRRLRDADLELATALGREPLCSYHSPEGSGPSRIDGLLVDTRLAASLHAAERLPLGAISGQTQVCFDLHLRGVSQRVDKLVHPKPVVPAQREEHERLLLVQGVASGPGSRGRGPRSGVSSRPRRRTFST